MGGLRQVLPVSAMRSCHETTSVKLFDLSLEDWMVALTAFLISLTKHLTRNDLQVKYFSFPLEEVQPHHGGKGRAAGSSLMEEGTADTKGQTIKPHACPLAKRPVSFILFYETGLRPRLLRIPQSSQTVPPVWNKVFKHTSPWQTFLNGSAS